MSNKLTQFKPGQSGNPKGRPKRSWTWAGLFEEVGNTIEPKSGILYAQLIAKRIYRDSAKGNTHAQKILIDRMDGQAHQSTDITSNGKELTSLTFSDLLAQMKKRKQDETG